MSDNRLSQFVHKALKQERQSSNQNDAQQARRFGLFVQAALANLGISSEEMARRLALDPDLAQGILDGLLPLAEIDDDLLREIAKLLQHPPHTLGLLLGRDIPEENESRQEAYKKA
jgi:hypothetical protein